MNLCPAFSQIGGGQKAFLISAFSQLSSAKKILMPKWHILGWYVLLPFRPQEINTPAYL